MGIYINHAHVHNHQLQHIKNVSPGRFWTVSRERVDASREIQRNRFKETEISTRINRIFCNADMGNADIRKFCKLNEECSTLMRAAMNQYHLSARAYHRVLKLARTIADLANEEKISTIHLAEALQYRPQVI